MTERMNMLRIAGPERRREFSPQDPVTEITDKQWEEMRSSYDEKVESLSSSDIIALLFLNILDGSGKVVTDKYQRAMRTKWDARMWGGGGGDVSSVNMLAILKLCGAAQPEDTYNINWQNIESRLHSLLATQSSQAALLHTMSAKIAAPEKDFFSKEQKDRLCKIVEGNRVDTQLFFKEMAELKVLGWDNMPALTEEDWRRARTLVFNPHFNGGSEDFVEMAAAMRILAAKEVNVTGKGLELIMPAASHDENTLPQPEALHL